MSALKRYESVFGKKVVKTETTSKLGLKIKNALKEEMSATELDTVVDKIESVITGVIDDHGVDNSVVDSLTSAVKDLNAQNSVIDQIGILESKLSLQYKSLYSEAEETSEEDKKDDKKETDAEMKEKARLKRVKEMSARLASKTQLSEEDEEEETEEEELEEQYGADDEEDDLEEAITGIKTKKYASLYSEESETEEGDILDDMTGSDYDDPSISVDAMGNAPSDRDMEAEEDENASHDGA